MATPERTRVTHTPLLSIGCGVFQTRESWDGNSPPLFYLRRCFSLVSPVNPFREIPQSTWISPWNLQPWKIGSYPFLSNNLFQPPLKPQDGTTTPLHRVFGRQLRLTLSSKDRYRDGRGTGLSPRSFRGSHARYLISV